MDHRRGSRLAWSLAAAIAGVVAFGLSFPLADTSIFVLIGVPFLVVGALVASRRPDNPVGWLFLGFSAVAAIAFAGSQYWGSGPQGPGSRPGADFAASLAVHVWHPGFSLFILAFLLFPEGRLLSRRWLIATRLTAALGIVGLATGLFEHDFVNEMIGRDAGVRPLVTGTVANAAGVVFAVCVVSLVGMLVVSAVCIFLRFARSTSTLRQQMKWVVTAVVVFAVALPGSLLLLGGAYGIVTLPLIPIAAGIAILRYRLFDIDLIINRALIYTTLTAVLAVIYTVGTLGGGALVRVATGQQRNDSWVVAASTLAVAALFRPVRTRVQAFIERRFYRRKYDATQTLADFSIRLRDLVDLDSLHSELLAAARQTMQPTHVSLWLRKADVP